MTKRGRFYLYTHVFDYDLSAYAIAVFAYLSLCANRNGECFPSVAKIAANCGVSRGTVGKAIKDLEAKGLITKRYTFQPVGDGKLRQTSNLYRLVENPVDNLLITVPAG